MHMKLLVTVTLLAAAAAWGQKFDLSTGKLELYSAERGYGFEEGATLKAGAGSTTCEKPPFYFSMRVPQEGNYRVTVTLGDREAATVTTIKAELRRLMVEKVETRPGEFVKRTFLVNTRTPEIAGGGEVRLKDREKTSMPNIWRRNLYPGFLWPRFWTLFVYALVKTGLWSLSLANSRHGWH